MATLPEIKSRFYLEIRELFQPQLERLERVRKEAKACTERVQAYLYLTQQATEQIRQHGILARQALARHQTDDMVAAITEAYIAKKDAAAASTTLTSKIMSSYSYDSYEPYFTFEERWNQMNRIFQSAKDQALKLASASKKK